MFLAAAHKVNHHWERRVDSLLLQTLSSWCLEQLPSWNPPPPFLAAVPLATIMAHQPSFDRCNHALIILTSRSSQRRT